MRFRLTIGWTVRLIVVAAANCAMARMFWESVAPPRSKGFWLGLAGFLLAFNAGALPALIGPRVAPGAQPDRRARYVRVAVGIAVIAAAIAMVAVAKRW